MSSLIDICYYKGYPSYTPILSTSLIRRGLKEEENITINHNMIALVTEDISSILST